eukprot:Blabericola_migrator_1__6017@NODE_3030_length_2101_cov_7_520649_g1895_i0_p1_GENE_NODE_3030_length_2101_cov_7_520649_g1895_i0NODE_3030_length_2101_cov_7_520649_g1895_i0_p1_ORF_typecomplete_len191_score33_99_NODE_3030_length_2101_cov_7_520649_g1895_i013361908
METEIKQKFISCANSLWPLLTENLEPKVSRTLNEKYAETFKMLTQTRTLMSLFQRVKRLTLDRKVQALISYLFVLNSFISGVGETWPDLNLKGRGLDMTCAKSFRKGLRDFHDDLISRWCRTFLTGRLPEERAVFVSNHPTGIFTICGDIDNLDQAQYEQLQCRRQVDPPWGTLSKMEGFCFLTQDHRKG